VIIDSHQHFWSIHRENDYGFLTPEAGVLYRDYLPEHLRPILSKEGIQYTIAVQAAQSIEETKWLLNVVEDVDYVLGVVGWLDMDTDHAHFSSQLSVLRKHKKFIGVRPMLQDIEDDRWILRDQVITNLKWLASEDFPFDILVYPRHLPYIFEMLERVAGLRAVVDHLAKPNIKDGEIEDWGRWLEKISAFPNVYCKLSGMVTEADHANWKKEDMIPFVDHALQCFGPDRVMFGSDWPVCNLAAAYETVYRLLKRIAAELGADRRAEAIFGGNATKFYKLNEIVAKNS